MKNLLIGIQHVNYIQSDSEHTVVSVPNKQVLNNVIDAFKQRSGISFATYRKPKDFGQRGENRKHFRDHIFTFKFRNQIHSPYSETKTEIYLFFFLRIPGKTVCAFAVQESKGAPYNSSSGSSDKHNTCNSTWCLLPGLQLWS